MAQSNAANGIPPQIHALAWSPDFTNFSFVTAGAVELFFCRILVGERCVKFWSLSFKSVDNSLTTRVGIIHADKQQVVLLVLYSLHIG